MKICIGYSEKRFVLWYILLHVTLILLIHFMFLTMLSFRLT